MQRAESGMRRVWTMRLWLAVAPETCFVIFSILRGLGATFARPDPCHLSTWASLVPKKAIVVATLNEVVPARNSEDRLEDES